MTISDDETDQRVIKAIQQGKHDALAELYDRHNSWLMAVAYRILDNRLDAEDLLHDVFVEIWKKSASYDSTRGTVCSWLAVKIRSRALDRLRALRAVHKNKMVLATLEHNSTAPEIECVVNHALARQMLDQLTPNQRTVIEFSYFRGFTCQEIANHCHMPLGTVKSVLLRAIQVLQREFNRHKVQNTCLSMKQY